MNTKKYMRILLHTMPWWGIKQELTLMRLHATFAESSSVLDNLVLSLNASVMEDNIENDKENVTKYHEECFKEFTPIMPQTNSVWIRLGSEHAYCSCLSHHEVWLIAALALPFFILHSPAVDSLAFFAITIWSSGRDSLDLEMELFWISSPKHLHSLPLDLPSNGESEGTSCGSL